MIKKNKLKLESVILERMRFKELLSQSNNWIVKYNINKLLNWKDKNVINKFDIELKII